MQDYCILHTSFDSHHQHLKTVITITIVVIDVIICDNDDDDDNHYAYDRLAFFSRFIVQRMSGLKWNRNCRNIGNTQLLQKADGCQRNWRCQCGQYEQTGQFYKAQATSSMAVVGSSHPFTHPSRSRAAFFSLTRLHTHHTLITCSGHHQL